jgi:hypothetical protein
MKSSPGFTVTVNVSSSAQSSSARIFTRFASDVPHWVSAVISYDFPVESVTSKRSASWVRWMPLPNTTSNCAYGDV